MQLLIPERRRCSGRRAFSRLPQFLSGRRRIRTANRIFSNQPEGARNGGDDTLSVPAGDGSLTTSARVATELKSEAEEVVGLR